MVSCLIGDVQIAELLLARGASIHSTAMESKIVSQLDDLLSITIAVAGHAAFL